MIRLKAEISVEKYEGTKLSNISSNYGAQNKNDISNVIVRNNTKQYSGSRLGNDYGWFTLSSSYQEYEFKATCNVSVKGNTAKSSHLSVKSCKEIGPNIYEITAYIVISDTQIIPSYNKNYEYTFETFKIKSGETVVLPPQLDKEASAKENRLIVLARVEAKPYIITINGTNISKLNLVFDKRNNEHPTEIIFDLGDSTTQTIACNSPDIIVDLDKPVDTLTMSIYKWNTPNRPLTLTNINTIFPLIINQMQDISYSHKRQSNNELPSWGIISNSGNLTFNDHSGQIESLIKSNTFGDNDICEIFLENTLVVGKQEKVAEAFISKWNYDNDNYVVNATLKDDLEEWQDIYIEGLNYDPRDTQGKTMEDIYKYLCGLTPSKYNMMSFDELAQNTKSQLTNTLCKYPIIKQGTLWQSWYKLCQVCQLYIYKNKLNQTMCSYDLGA